MVDLGSKTDILQQLKAVRQVVGASHSLFKDRHEQVFGPIGPTVDTFTTTSVSFDVPPLQLTVPSFFFSQVEKHDLPASARDNLARTVDLLKADYAQQFKDACLKLIHSADLPRLKSLLPVVIEKLRNELQHFFESNGLRKLLDELTSYSRDRLRLSSFSTPPPAPRQSSIPAYEAPVPFNNEYTPILETYFQYDPYPTSRDRQIIAERSGMTRRQIEVWFQNHRRTARQSGITLPAKRPPGAIAPPGLNVPFSVGQEPDESSGEKRRKARMLDMFNINSKIPRIPGGSSGSGQGMTPDDPIQIDGTAEMTSMISEHYDETRMGMTLTNAGNGISVLEPIDVVERMVREKERKAVEEEMKEERKKYLSVIAPPSFNNNHPISAPISPNPLDSPLSSPDTLFPAPFTRPPAHLQFRYRVAPDSSSSPSSSSTRTFSPTNDTDSTITGTVRPILPPPSWTRLAPPTSYQLPPPPTSTSTSTSTTPHPPPKPKKKPKRPTKEELRLLEDSKRTLEIDEAIMMKRLWFCSFDDRVESGTIRAQGGVSTYESIPGGVVEREKSGYAASANSNSNSNKPKSSTAKSILQKLGVGLDAATCAYTYVLPKAPFWALVRDGSDSSSSSASSSFSFSSSASSSSSSSSTASSSSSSLASHEFSVSSSHKSTRKGVKKPAALGPKRKPRNAPSGVQAASAANGVPSVNSVNAINGVNVANGANGVGVMNSVGFTQFAGAERTLNTKEKGKGKAKAVSLERDEFSPYRYTSDSSFGSSSSSSHSSLSTSASSSSSASSSTSAFSSSSAASSSSSTSSAGIIPPPNPPIIPQGFPEGFTPFSNNTIPASLSETQPQVGFTYAFGNPYPTSTVDTSFSSSVPTSSSPVPTIPTSTSTSTILPTSTSTTTSTDPTLAHTNVDVQGIDMNMLNALFSDSIGAGASPAHGAGTNPYLNPMTMNMGSFGSVGSVGSSSVGMTALAAFGGMAALGAGVNMGMGVGMGGMNMGMGLGGVGGMGVGGMGGIGMGGWSSS
ncbi:homeodomain protein [Lentinula edodes]|nr:homeodomain protein [Lentinula edodes]